MELLDHIDALIDERHLLKHPFYTKWAEGTLPLLKQHLRQAQQIASSIGIDTAAR